jgi:hypothetical protein
MIATGQATKNSGTVSQEPKTPYGLHARRVL